MGWVAAAGGTVVASLFLLQIYKKINDRTKPLQGQLKYVTNISSEEESEEKSPKSEEEGPTISVELHNDASVTLQSPFGSGLSKVQTTESLDHGQRSTLAPEADRLAMPPPPRPASAPIPHPAHARLTSTMPPPSSLPTSRNRSPPRLKPASASTPPRSVPTLNGGGALRTTPSAASSLRVPPQKVLQNTKMQPSLSPASISTLPPSRRPSRKVILSPGHSPLDWAALQRSASQSAVRTLRGRDASSLTDNSPVALLRVTPSMLKRQTGRKGKDAWTSYQGRVYNISAYLPFHPGGEHELIKGAGRASDELFAEVHPWVNWEGMLAECCVGIMVGEHEGSGDNSGGSGGLDEMD